MHGSPISRTAEYMALFRALETARPRRRRLCEDRWAHRFLKRSLRAVACSARVPGVRSVLLAYIDHRWPGARTSGVARTRFIDDFVATTLGAGIAQVAILGAGFDARAYRLPALREVRVFEVDQAATSIEKQRRVAALLGALPRHVRYVAVDFKTGSLPEAMCNAGFDARARTLFLWEGVTNYLTADAVDAMLGWCGRAAPGSALVFTYVDRKVLDRPQAYAGTTRLFTRLARSGERWTFGIDPHATRELLARQGLELEQDMSAAEYRARYYGNAAKGMRGYEFYRVAVARVKVGAMMTAGAHA